MESILTIMSANCQGLRDIKKRNDVIDYLKNKNFDICCLQDTHLIETDINNLEEIWGHECIVNGSSTNSRGVAILFGKNFEYKILGHSKDDNGNVLIVNLKLKHFSVKIINVYAPNTDNPDFFTKISNEIQNNTEDYIIWCGDFNIILDQTLDSNNYLAINNPRARNTLLQIIDENDLIDTFRNIYPNTKRYTWRKKILLNKDDWITF